MTVPTEFINDWQIVSFGEENQVICWRKTPNSG